MLLSRLPHPSSQLPDISATTFTILISIDLPTPSDDDEPPPSILLTVTYSPDYPSVAPDLSISFPHNGSRPPHLFLPEDTPHLLSTLTDPINDCLGTAMIFTLVTTLKESVETLIADRLNAVQEAEEAEKRKEEEKEDEKFHGEKVTRERFLEWSEKFKKEMEERKAEEERKEEEENKRGAKAKKDEVKLTGKELWERGLVGKEAEEEDEVVSGVAALKTDG